MRLTLYQIDFARYAGNRLFAPLEEVRREYGRVDPVIYTRVWTADMSKGHAAKALEELYALLNPPPAELLKDGYRGRSMSVSDVVVVSDCKRAEAGAYYCDSFGFARLSEEEWPWRD